MKTIKLIQKFVLSLLVTTLVSVSADTECTNEICSHTAPPTKKLGCNDKACHSLSVGGGALYNSAKGSSVGAASSNTGGFIFGESSSLFWQKLYLSTSVRVGFGLQKPAGVTITNLVHDNLFIYLDGLFRAGYNIATPSLPLFLNFTAGYDAYLGGIDRVLFVIGAELQGSVPISEVFRITYSLGYNWNVFGIYGISNVNIIMKPKNYAAFYSVTLGLLAEVSDKIAFYVRALGKYYDLPTFYRVVPIPNDTLVDYPSLETFTAILEFGFRYR